MIIPAFVIYLAFSMMLLAMVITVVRLIAGPTVNDRITAMDLIASIIMGIVLVYSILVRNAIFFDVPVIISLISFISTVAVSTYLKIKNG